jgi:hypothetical protein
MGSGGAPLSQGGCTCTRVAFVFNIILYVADRLFSKCWSMFYIARMELCKIQNQFACSIYWSSWAVAELHWAKGVHMHPGSFSFYPAISCEISVRTPIISTYYKLVHTGWVCSSSATDDNVAAHAISGMFFFFSKWRVSAARHRYRYIYPYRCRVGYQGCV